MSEPVAVGFTGLVDLASGELGGEALGSSDDFFAEASRLLLPGRGVFIADKYTDRGKWMDGWESRRRRVAPGAIADGSAPDHDWCVVRLGAPGEVVGFDVDTNHFLGNHPPFASIDGLYAPDARTLADLAGRDWTPLLAQVPLRAGSQNLFGAIARGPTSHVRLNIFPDGGVARLRVFGRVSPPGDDAAIAGLDAEARAHVAPGARDLAAVKNGGVALACSDAFFGPMNNLLLPGRSSDMGGGWETRRRRGPGHDWILIQLGARGVPDVVEVDTNHFKGNYPARFSLDAIDAAAGARITDLIASRDWTELLPETPLGPHARHFFAGLAAASRGRLASHVRLNIFPDGGVSRLRVWSRGG